MELTRACWYFILNYNLGYTFKIIMPIIGVFAYLVDKNGYIILWGIVKFGDGGHRIRLSNSCCSVN